MKIELRHFIIGQPERQEIEELILEAWKLYRVAERVMESGVVA